MSLRLFLPLSALTVLSAPALAQELLHELASPTPQSFGQFGYDVAGVPDADGDGRGDFLVGAAFEGNGRAYLFSGATGALLRTLVSPSAEAYGFFGSAVSGVPDVDGDGRSDLLVGAPGEGDGGVLEWGPGRAHVFSGATGAVLYSLRSPNEERIGSFGSVAGVMDLDGDERGDVVVGAAGESPGPSPEDAGRAYVFSGATGRLLRELRSPNEEEDGFFGNVVSGVEDVDGDGRGEVVVGAPWEDTGAGTANAGRAYAFSSATGGVLYELTSPDEEEYGHFGWTVAGVEDADGDGRGDLLVGAPDENPDLAPSVPAAPTCSQAPPAPSSTPSPPPPGRSAAASASRSRACPTPTMTGAATSSSGQKRAPA